MKVDEGLIQQLAERLKQAVRDTRHIEIAQIQIIGLDSIKRRAGPLWSELAVRVRETSRDFISKRIGPHDVLIPAGDGFLIVYAEPQGASDKSRALQGALNAFYLGQSTTRELTAAVEHRTLGAAVLREHLDSAAGGQVGRLPAHAPPATGETPLAVLPVWSVLQEAVTGYWITPAHPARPLPHFGYDPTWSDTGHSRDDSDFLLLDLRILERAAADAQACLVSGRRCLVGYSAHSSTLMHKARRQTFLQALSAVPTDVRPLLLGRVAEVQPGTPMATIADWVHQMRPVTPRVAIEIHHSQKDLTGLEEVGIFSVACVVPTLRPGVADAASLARTVTLWARDLKRQNLKLRIDNLNDPRLLALVTDAHVDFCSSPRLWPAVAAAEGMKPYSREQFLRNLPLTAAERRFG